MRKHKRLWLVGTGLAVVVLIATTLVTVGLFNSGQTEAAPPPNVVIYDLYSTDGWWTMADGTQIYSYGFIGGREGSTISYLDKFQVLHTALVTAPTPGPGGPEAALAGYAQFPAPLIYCKVGDVVQINLKNLGVTEPEAPNDPHSIHLHGLDVDAANDGVPETSVAAVPANSGLPGAGNVVVYMFSPKIAATYFYHCHQEASIHVTMGMYGALIVYNKTDQGATLGPGYSGSLYSNTYQKDYVMLLSDTDINQHAAEQGVLAEYNPVDYKPQYWFINGISFPNTVHAGINYTNWLLAHPGYETLISGRVRPANNLSGTRGGERVLIRMINMGFQTQPMHVHGFHFKVIGSDQRGWLVPWEKNTITIGSGETYELLFDFSMLAVTSTYQPSTQTRYDTDGNMPKSNTQTGFPVIPDPSGLPYIGGPMVSGAVGLPGSSQLFPFHNHDDYKATNNGSYPGGMFTMVMPLP